MRPNHLTGTVARSAGRRHLAVLRTRWLRVLLGGAGVYAVVTAAAIDTENINLVPVVLVLGAALIPLTFVTYVCERITVSSSALAPLAVCCIAGGSLGVAAASVLEYQTLRDLGTLPMIAVGVIEEAVKLAVPVWLFLRRRVHDPGEGVLFGVAAGIGFAVLETMGYGLVALIHSRGQIGAAEEV